jgi:citryl-CoA lyase
MEKRENPVTRLSDTSYNHLVSGYPLLELTGNITLTESIYLNLKGELPTERELKMLDALLTCGISGGGIGEAQVQTARVIATANRDDPMAALAGAMLAYGSTTGSPGFTAQFIEDNYALMKEEGLTKEQLAQKVIADTRKQGKRIPGLGHRWYHGEDPRGMRIRECQEFYGFVGEKTLMYDAVSDELTKVIGRPMRPNIDGAFGAAALEMGFSPIVIGPVFALGLLSGNIAQIEEEIMEHESRSIRRFIDERIGWQYIGPPPRRLPKDKIKVPFVKVKLQEE